MSVVFLVACVFSDSNIYALKLIKLNENRDVVYSEIEVLSKFKGASQVIQLIDYEEDTDEGVIMLVSTHHVATLWSGPIDELHMRAMVIAAR